MRRLSNFNLEDYPTMLGKTLINSNPPGTAVPMDPDRRVILIGLGGSGLKTLDRIKGELTRTMEPDRRSLWHMIFTAPTAAPR